MGEEQDMAEKTKHLGVEKNTQREQTEEKPSQERGRRRLGHREADQNAKGRRKGRWTKRRRTAQGEDPEAKGQGGIIKGGLHGGGGKYK